jgi:hypothetical protein
MKIIALLATVSLLQVSCAGYSITVKSPYGEINTDKDGSVTVTPKPVVIPAK